MERPAVPTAGLVSHKSEKQMLKRQKKERRRMDASFFVVERRRGFRWKYASIALCLVLWAKVWLLLRA